MENERFVILKKVTVFESNSFFVSSPLKYAYCKVASSRLLVSSTFQTAYDGKNLMLKNCDLWPKESKIMDGIQFLWLSWFSAKNKTCVNICITVYMRQKLATFGIYEILGPTFAAFRPTQQKTRHKLSSVVYCRLVLNYYSRAIG